MIKVNKNSKFKILKKIYCDNDNQINMLKTVKALGILNEDLDRSKTKLVKLFDSHKIIQKCVYQTRLLMRFSRFLIDKIKIKLKELDTKRKTKLLI